MATKKYVEAWLAYDMYIRLIQVFSESEHLCTVFVMTTTRKLLQTRRKHTHRATREWGITMTNNVRYWYQLSLIGS